MAEAPAVILRAMEVGKQAEKLQGEIAGREVLEKPDEEDKQECEKLQMDRLG